MYKKIIVPVDESHLAEYTFDYAREIAARLNSDVVILEAVESGEAGAVPAHRDYVTTRAEKMRTQIAAAMKRLGKDPAAAPRVSGEVVRGYPADAILRFVQENDGDLILMSTHGRTGIMRWVMGSVADKVLRASPVPVLLIRSAAAQKGDFGKWTDITLIVALDGSPMAESVLPHVQALGQQTLNDFLKVILIRICEPPPTPAISAPELPMDWQKLREESWASCKKMTQEYLSGVERHLHATGLSVTSRAIEEMKSSPAEEIIKFADGIPSSLIVMSTCGRSGISRWAYGSVAQKVLMGSSRPVLLVRPAVPGEEAGAGENAEEIPLPT